MKQLEQPFSASRGNIFDANGQTLLGGHLFQTFADADEVVAILNRGYVPKQKLTEPQIKHMVDRFLSWRLPENFAPDGGISFKPTFNEHTDYVMKHEPTGTNLFDATQADAMVRYMVEGMPVCQETTT